MTLPLHPPALSVADAPRDMRHAYLGGAPGLLTSATVWLVAGVVALQLSPDRAIWTLFVGGMLIHPLSVLLTKALGRPGAHAAGNPLGRLALESTAWMVLSLPLAYAVSRLHIEWFFPAMMLVIGGRYLTFATLYGTRAYWACGLALVTAAWLLARANAAPAVGAFTGAAIEAGFALLIWQSARREAAPAGLRQT